MTREKLLSVLDIAKELDKGKATIKFLLKRFKNWLPSDVVNGQPFYPADTVKKLFVIQERLEMGILPSDIEKKLATLSLDSADISQQVSNTSQNKDIRLSNDGLMLIKSFVHDIGEQQKRIALAHEKRAAAEERKAAAIEKRAGAEEKKADAMNNIAAALQEMNSLRAGESGNQQLEHQIARQVAEVIVPDETDGQDMPIEPDDLSDHIHDADLFSLLDGEDIPEDFLITDELAEALDQEDHESTGDSTDLDDLASLVEDETKGEGDDASNKLDDLSALIDEKDKAAQPDLSGELDDLSKLVDDTPELDDLSKLIDEKPGLSDQALDNLSLLIDPEPVLETNAFDALKMDDLSALIDHEETLPDSHGQMDDLSKLIDADTPAIMIDISPEEDLEKYKAAIMKMIIELKTAGLRVEETTNQLNKNKIQTLSGKPEWNQKAISQIYKFIESAK